MPYGILTTAHTGIPDNVDLSRLNVYQTAEGVGYGQALTFARTAARAFGAFDWPGHENEADLLRYLLAPSANDQLRWRSGDLASQRVTADFEGDLVSQHRTRSGSQVPDVRTAVPVSGVTFETTRPGRNAIAQDEIESDIMESLETLILDMYLEALRTVSYKAARAVLGSTTGKGVGWVGGDDQDFVPRRRKGKSFETHSHYLTDATYADTEAGRRALFQAFRDTLWEHEKAHTPTQPLLLLHGSDSLSDVRTDDFYKEPTIAGVSPGDDQTTVLDVPRFAHGKLTDSGAWTVDVGPGLPEHYYVMVKSYGPLNPRNPVRLFYPQDVGFGPLLFDARSRFPLDGNTPMDAGLLQSLVYWLQYGEAVADPEAGVAGLIGGAGSWTDPTVA